MSRLVYRYRFAEDVAIEDVEASLILAIFAAEALHGEAETRLDASHYLDPTARTCVIDGGTPVGRDLNRLFVGFLRREFGDDAFRVRRARKTSLATPPWVPATA